jgi:hypothetical protein
MPDQVTSKLRALAKKASGAGLYALSAAADQALAAPDDLDRRINVVGAMHEVGLLRNSLDPLWAALRTDERAWSRRCLLRLQDKDHDYWAVAALLGCGALGVLKDAVAAGFSAWSLRYCERYDQPRMHVASLSRRVEGSVRAPVLELGWDTQSNELVDCSRYRAVLMESTRVVKGSVVGTGSYSYGLTAKLPYGSWRVHEGEIRLEPEWGVPMGDSLLAQVDPAGGSR